MPEWSQRLRLSSRMRPYATQFARIMSRWTGLGTALVAVAACTPDAPTMVGEHVTLVIETPNTEICPGTIKYLDEAYAQIAALMEVPIESLEPVRYHYVAEEGFPCGDLTFGCASADGRDVWGRGVRYTHELVHSVFSQAYGVASIPYLEEGLAVALGQPIVSLGWDFASLDSEVLAETGYDLDQVSAGHLTAYLVDTYGYPAFEAVASMLTTGASREEIDAAFLSVYGKDLASIVAEIDVYFINGVRLGLPECAMAPESWVDGRVELRTTFDCSDPRIVGDLSRDDGLLFASIQIDSGGTYLRRTHGTMRPKYGWCASVPYYIRPSTGETSGHRLAWLGMEQGRHFVILAGDPGVEASVEIEAVPTIPVQPCLNEVPTGVATVDSTVEAIGIAASPIGPVPEAHFLLEQATSAAYSGSGVTSLELCRGTCDAQVCVPLDGLPGSSVALEPGYYVLRGQRALASSGAGAVLLLTAL